MEMSVGYPVARSDINEGDRFFTFSYSHISFLNHHNHASPDV
jgi:hypothetical protein